MQYGNVEQGRTRLLNQSCDDILKIALSATDSSEKFSELLRDITVDQKSNSDSNPFREEIENVYKFVNGIKFSDGFIKFTWTDIKSYSVGHRLDIDILLSEHIKRFKFYRLLICVQFMYMWSFSANENKKTIRAFNFNGYGLYFK